MSYSPAGIWNPPVGSISPFSLESIGMLLRTYNFSTANGTISGISSGSGFFYPFELGATSTVNGGSMYCVTNATGTFDIGVYRASGSRIVSTGSTTLVNGINNVLLSATLQPGRYYLAISMSSFVPTYGVILSNPSVLIAAAGVKIAASQTPLSATVSFSDFSGSTSTPTVALSLVQVAL